MSLADLQALTAAAHAQLRTAAADVATAVDVDDALASLDAARAKYDAHRAALALHIDDDWSIPTPRTLERSTR